MSNKDIILSISNETVTSVKITIDSNLTPQAGATYSVWYDDCSYVDDEDRDGYKWYGGHIPITDSEIVINGLLPNVEYFLRVFEVDPGNAQSPGLLYDYSDESSFTTNATLQNPRLTNPYCTTIPSDNGPGPGNQITESTTSIRIGTTYYSYGIGAVDRVERQYEWKICGSKAIQIVSDTLEY